MTVRRMTMGCALLLGAVVALVGCGDGGAKDAASKDGRGEPSAGGESALDAVLVAAAPGEAKSVADLKASAKEGDEVVMRVVIGGRVEPIVANRAVMTVVDASQFNNCLTEEDGCLTPWDYCCVAQEDLLRTSATVQLVDAQGRPLAIDLKPTKLKPLATLVVKGKVGPRPDPQSLVVNASEIFVEKSP